MFKIEVTYKCKHRGKVEIEGSRTDLKMVIEKTLIQKERELCPDCKPPEIVLTEGQKTAKNVLTLLALVLLFLLMRACHDIWYWWGR